MLFDSHAHLNFQAFDKDWEEVVKRTLAEHVNFIIVGTNAKTSQRAIELSEKARKQWGHNILVAVGLHPIYLARDITEKEIIGGKEYYFTTHKEKFNEEVFEQLVKNSSVTAIGEIGLDYFHLDNYRGDALKAQEFVSVQKKTLEEMLFFAEKVNEPVILHCRDAYDDLIEILTQHPGVRGVVHCFSGTREQAQKLLELGFYLGITGIVTFPNAKELQQIVADLPLEKILIETDCPYLAPQAVRGKRNEPRFVQYVASKIAELQNRSCTEVAKSTYQNAVCLFMEKN